MASASKARNPVVLSFHVVIRTACWLALVDFSLMAVSKHFVLQCVVFLFWIGLFYFRVLRPFVRFMLPRKLGPKAGPSVAEKGELDKSAAKPQPAAQPASSDAQAEATPSPRRKYAKSVAVAPSSKKP
jgi:hypothetical protein